MPSKPENPERKKALTAGALALCAVVAWLLFWPNGILQYYRITQDLRAVRAEIARLEKENEMLQEEIDKLLNDPGYLEKIAREQYDFIKKNEVIYDFEKRRKKR